MKLSKNEQHAIIAYTADNGGYRRLMHELDVSEPTAIRIGKGRAVIIQNHIWKRLEPLIAPYLATIGQPMGDDSRNGLSATKRPLETSKSDSPSRLMLEQKLDAMTEQQVELVLAFAIQLLNGDPRRDS